MKKDLFALVPTEFETSLTPGLAGTETFVDLEYQGQLTPELSQPVVVPAPQMIGAKVLVAILLLPLMLTGCLLESKSSKETYNYQPVPTPTPFAIPKVKDVTIEVSKMTDFAVDNGWEEYIEAGINKYVISIKLPLEYANTAKVERLHENTGTYEKTSFDADIFPMPHYSGIKEVLDLSQETLETHTYTYEVTYGEGLKKSFTISVKPDLLIKGKKHLSSLTMVSDNLDIDTLYIKPGGQLIFRKDDVRLNVKTVISQGGIYSESGRLSIFIGQLLGHLSVEVNGYSESQDSKLFVDVRELRRFNEKESCGVSTRLVSANSEPYVNIGLDECNVAPL